jgi:hypothetical protein
VSRCGCGCGVCDGPEAAGSEEDWGGVGVDAAYGGAVDAAGQFSAGLDGDGAGIRHSRCYTFDPVDEE